MRARSNRLDIGWGEGSSLAAVFVALVAPCIAVESARACGPDFPERLLDKRGHTLRALIDGVFAAEAAQLTAPLAGLVVVEDGNDAARKNAPGLPDETRLYAEGADAWNRGDAVAAERKWRHLLTLPEADRPTRSTWATFMLAKATGNVRWYQKTRALAQRGFGDALGLGVASLGDEALARYVAGDIAAAVHLYAQQAALGSQVGETSLLFVARHLVNDEDALARVIRDPVVQRLVGAYLYSRADELADMTGPDDDGTVQSAQLKRLLRAIDRRHVVKMEAAGELAAVAYRAGLFDVADRFSRLSDAPLAEWVKGKLAIRAGRLDEADAHLARAGSTSADPTRGRPYPLDAERALLAVQRGAYADALTLLLDQPWPERYWLDAAYVAERVMTSDELLAFLAARYSTSNATGAGRGLVDGERRPAPDALRNLLARRLMREGRPDEADRFFTDDATRQSARELTRLQRDADAAPPGVDRARALYETSRIMRRSGLEIVGYELAPDWAYADGQFDLVEVEHWDDDLAQGVEDRLVPDVAHSTLDERARVVSSRAAPNVRFHYRVLAAQMAARAADSLPPRSQAYAAVLCKASSYVIDRDSALSSSYWRRYLNTGAAAADYGDDFGRSCKPPDFDAAARLASAPAPHGPAPHPRSRHPRRDAARDLVVVIAAVLAVALAGRACARRVARGSGQTEPQTRAFLP